MRNLLLFLLVIFLVSCSEKDNPKTVTNKLKNQRPAKLERIEEFSSLVAMMMYGFDYKADSVVINVKLKNISEKSIYRIDFKMLAYDVNKKLIKEHIVSIDDEIKPGELKFYDHYDAKMKRLPDFSSFMIKIDAVYTGN